MICIRTYTCPSNIWFVNKSCIIFTLSKEQRRHTLKDDRINYNADRSNNGYHGKAALVSTAICLQFLCFRFSVLVPQKNIEHRVIRKLPQLHDDVYWREHLAKTDKEEYLVLPGKITNEKKL